MKSSWQSHQSEESKFKEEEFDTIKTDLEIIM